MTTKMKTPDLGGGRAQSNAVTSYFNHPYLERKEIPLASLQAVTKVRIEIRGKILFRELVNAASEPQGFERIWPDGIKKVTPGGTVRATFTPFGFYGTEVLRIRGLLIVCAGLADGYRIHEVTGAPVACGVGENNLKSIADALFTAAPHADLLVAADNDEAGIRAAKATGRCWIVPKDIQGVHHGA